MVHQALGIGRGESIIEVYGNVALADGRHEDGHAHRAALAVDGDLVAGLDAGFLPNQVKRLDLFREFAIADRGLPEVAQRRTVPTVADGAFEELDEVVDLDHKIFLLFRFKIIQSRKTGCEVILKIGIDFLFKVFCGQFRPRVGEIARTGAKPARIDANPVRIEPGKGKNVRKSRQTKETGGQKK